MKIQKVRKISFVIISALLLTMAGCKYSADNSASDTPETPEVTEVPETPQTPVTPTTPKVPETPLTPEAPKEPETPVIPEEPDDGLYDTKYKAVLDFYTAKYGEHMINQDSCESGFYLTEEGYAIPEELAMVSNTYPFLLYEDTSKSPKEAVFAIQAKEGFYIQDGAAYLLSEVLSDDISFSEINHKTGYWKSDSYKYCEHLYDTKYKAVLKELTVKYGDNMLEDGSGTLDGYVPVSTGQRFYAIPMEYNEHYWNVVLIREDPSKTPPEATFSIQALQGYYVRGEDSVKIEDARNFSVINPKTGYWQWITDEYSN